MARRGFLHLALLCAVVGVGSSGCALVFTDDEFQSLRLVFELDRTIEAGSETLIHSAVFTEPVDVRKRFVQLSGRLVPAAGTALPGRVTLTAVLEDGESGEQKQKISLVLAVGSDGGFSARKKIKKDIGSGEMLLIAIEPAGGDLEAGTSVTLCADLVAKKGDLKKLPPCVAEGDGGAGEAETLSALQSAFLTPSCALAGCHNAASAQAGLVLAQGQSFANLVGVSSSQVPSLLRVQPGDPDRSYLVKKLRGDADIEGGRMPAGGPFLTADEIARFESWINDGAPDN
jgi:hypothetical protein